jgi:ABC-type transport system involved in multi-copper enzyme maturation permease subunit
MKLTTIATNTFGMFLRDKLLIIVGALFVGVILMMMTPLLTLKAKTTASNIQGMQSYVLQLVSVIMSMVSGAGSLLAAWAAADAVATEMKTGTILAVMARPVKRWEFLLGKYLGVLMLMALYVAMTFALSFILAWMGGQRIPSAPWVLLAYPMVRYAIYGAIAMALATIAHPVMSWAFTLLLGVVAGLVVPAETQPAKLALRWLKTGLYYLLPSTDFLSEDRFLSIKDSALHQTGWVEHLTTLTYGLDYALVMLLIAMWLFHYRSLKRD